MKCRCLRCLDALRFEGIRIGEFLVDLGIWVDVLNSNLVDS